MDRALSWFINGWVALAMAVNAVAVAGFLITAPTLWAGLQRVSSTYSPFNVWNFTAELVLLSPAFGAYYWRERRRRQRGES